MNCKVKNFQMDLTCKPVVRFGGIFVVYILRALLINKDHLMFDNNRMLYVSVLFLFFNFFFALKIIHFVRFYSYWRRIMKLYYLVCCMNMCYRNCDFKRDKRIGRRSICHSDKIFLPSQAIGRRFQSNNIL